MPKLYFQDRSKIAKEAMIWRGRTQYMRGWDDSLINRHKQNPYQRRDARDNWEQGRKSCLEGKPLPYWYSEWKERVR
jgi:hypothetical protein